MDETRLGVTAGVGAVQPFLVGQDDQQVGLDQVGHQRAQRVVVAKLDLVVDHRVVFVDDRHHAQVQQGQQRAAGVQVAFAVGQVGVREQHLRTVHALLAQLGFVHLRQTHLADGGGGLQFVDFTRAHLPAQALHALGHGAAGNHDDFPVFCARAAHQCRQLPAPFANGHLVQAPAFVGHQAGAHLHHYAPRAAQHFRNVVVLGHFGL